MEKIKYKIIKQIKMMYIMQIQYKKHQWAKKRYKKLKKQFRFELKDICKRNNYKN